MLSIFLSAFTCYNYPDYEDEDHHYKIYFENRWDKPIVIWAVMRRYPFNMYQPFNKLWRGGNVGVIIQPGKNEHDYYKYESYYEDLFMDGDSLHVFVYDSDDNNRKEPLWFLVSYVLSLDDLHQLNYHIPYPPTENMKDIRMWPSYDVVTTFSRKAR